MRLFFSSGEQGLIYDIQNINSLRQDLAGTVPAAVGSSVALITDQSGRGNHARMTTAINRPILRQDANGYYLEPNGTSTWMETAAINFTGTNNVTIFAGVQKVSDATATMICMLSPDVTANAGAFSFVSSPSNLPAYGFRSRGTALATANTTSSYPAGANHVVTGVGDISGDVCRITVNNDAATNSATDQGSGNYGNHKLFLFSVGGTSLFTSTRLRYLAIRGALCDAAQTAAARAFVARKMGVSL